MNGQQTLTIVGLGLMGASMAKALDDSGNYECWGCDRTGDVVKRALADHVITRGACLSDEEETRGILSSSRLVMLAMFPSNILPFLDQYRDCLKKGTLVMDLCGLKGNLVDNAQSRMPDGVEYLSTHPMAGREKSGYDGSTGELFLGSSFIITATEKNTPEGIEKAKQMARALGCGRIRQITPKEHDAIIAYTSHMPHVAAAALIHSWKGTEDIPSYAGGSFRDATRVAEMNTSLWTELFLTNRPHLITALKQYEQELATIQNLLEKGDAQELEAYLSASSERKIRWNERKDHYDE